jgi:hypothetical protein
MNKIDRMQRECWEAMVGDLLGEMLDNPMGTRRLLQHEESKVRSVALSVLLNYWKATSADSDARVYEKLIQNDPSFQVRAIASTCLSVCYEATGNATAKQLLATLVLNHTEALGVRESAYQGVFIVAGQLHMWPSFGKIPLVAFVFPDNVDWILFRQLVNG